MLSVSGTSSEGSVGSGYLVCSFRMQLPQNSQETRKPHSSILLAPTGDRKPSLKASGHSTSIGEPHQYGLMIECDGVLVDIHKDCHRVAFNKAFEVCLILFKGHDLLLFHSITYNVWIVLSNAGAWA